MPAVWSKPKRARGATQRGGRRRVRQDNQHSSHHRYGSYKYPSYNMRKSVTQYNEQYAHASYAKYKSSIRSSGVCVAASEAGVSKPNALYRQISVTRIINAAAHIMVGSKARINILRIASTRHRLLKMVAKWLVRLIFCGDDADTLRGDEPDRGFSRRLATYTRQPRAIRH